VKIWEERRYFRIKAGDLEKSSLICKGQAQSSTQDPLSSRFRLLVNLFFYACYTGLKIQHHGQRKANQGITGAKLCLGRSNPDTIGSLLLSEMSLFRSTNICELRVLINDIFAALSHHGTEVTFNKKCALWNKDIKT
jgi:hypothetical protein